MSLLDGLSTIFVRAGSQGLIRKELSVEVEASGAEFMSVFAKIGVTEAFFSRLSEALAELVLGLESRDKTSIARDDIILWFLGFLHRLRKWKGNCIYIGVWGGIRSSVHVFRSPCVETIMFDFAGSVVNSLSGVVVVSEVSHCGDAGDTWKYWDV